MGREDETVDAGPFRDLEMTCLLMAETNVKAMATLVPKAKEERDCCLKKHTGKQLEKIFVAFYVSQVGEQANAIEGMNEMASKAERGYVPGIINVLHDCKTNV